MSARIPESVTKLAPGEWKCGRYVAWYDEHLRAYIVFDEADIGECVVLVRTLVSFARWAEQQTSAAA